MSRRTNLLPGLVVAAAAIVLLIAPPVEAGHAWSNYHWERSSNPITIPHGDNVDPVKWKSHLDQAAADWDRSSVINAPVVAGATKPKSCRASDGRVEICSASYGNTGWLGIAQIWLSGEHIVRGVAKLNDYYHDSPPYNSFDWKQQVMCQEIGHLYGLGHQNEDFDTDLTNSCMEYTNQPAGNTTPDNHDYQMLEQIYAHLDGDGGGGGGGGGGGCWPPGKCKAPPAFDMPLPSIENWGRHVSTSKSGGQSVFVQDFGQGYKVFTFVTWTLEAAETNRAHKNH